jgi:uncharacterized protein (TIGR03435 family)
MQITWCKLLLSVSCVSALTVDNALGQGKGEPVFDAASIKVQSGRGGAPHESPGRVDYAHIGLRELVMKAYDVSDYQVVWPSWLEQYDPSFYEVGVIFPASTSKATLGLMWQHLLASRFGMVAHWETRSRPVYAMVVSPTGLHIQKSVSKTEVVNEGNDARATDQVPGGFTIGLESTNLSLKGDMPLSGISAVYGGYLDRPLVDATGLEGDYSIKLSVKTEPTKPDPNVRPGPITPDMLKEMMGWDNARFFEALRQQLGIEVEKRVMGLKTLVVERLNKVPTDN